MKPRLLKRDKKIQLSYDIPHRIHCAAIHPVAAPNGSTVIIYGHTTGLRIIWRGGRPRKKTTNQPVASSRPNGTGRPEVISLDDDDDEPSAPQHAASRTSEVAYEEAEEEQDPDCLYAGIVQDHDINIGIAVLHLALPSSWTSVSKTLGQTAIATVGLADGRLWVLQLPLTPPLDEEKSEYSTLVGQSRIELFKHAPGPSQLAVKIIASDAPSKPSQDSSIDMPQILIASATRSLRVWTLSLGKDENPRPNDARHLTTKALSAPACRLSFHPAPRNSQLLVASTSGDVSIWSIHAANAKPGDDLADSENADGSYLYDPVTWTTAFSTSFAGVSRAPGSVGLARRKKVLDAQWILNGKALLALLEDGEWGVWDLSGSSTSAAQNGQAFVARGFLGASAAAGHLASTRDRKTSSSLAPMTPNTRKVKSEALFTGVAKSPDVTSTGGIVVSAAHSRPGYSDESVVLWYDGSIYSINSTQAFWQRNLNNSGGSGSLHAAGVPLVVEIDLMNERVTSIFQFAQQSSSAGIGTLSVQRDLLITTDYRLSILQSKQQASRSGNLSQPSRPPQAAEDKMMLDAGNLDLEGMDRMLDGMAAGSVLGRQRRVGFAT